MKSTRTARLRRLVNHTNVAIAVALLGASFMVFVAVSLGIRYGVTFAFDPEHNSHIAVFIGSIAGALFTLTNALLLYATLQAQHRAQEYANDQHSELKQDRSYDRLSAMADRLETGIAAYSLYWDPQDNHHPVGGLTYHGYAGLNKTFEVWEQECTVEKIELRLAWSDRIDPDMFLTQQVDAMDLMFQLHALIQAIRTKEVDDDGIAHLSNRASVVLNRIFRSKQDLLAAATQLRRIVDKGILGQAKQLYASDLLHLERKIRHIADMMPDMPYRNLSPFEEVRATLTKDDPVAVFECATVPSFQIDVVEFLTTEKDWARRFTEGKLEVQVEGQSGKGRQLNYLLKPFSFGVLHFEAKHQGQVFDTQGRWFVEGSYNLMGATVDEHERWRIDVGVAGMELLQGEALELTLYTNAKAITGVGRIRRG